MKRGMVRFGFVLFAAALIAPGPAQAEQGASAVRFDFETGDLQGWRVVEGKFDFVVCDKKTFRNHPTEKYNKQGTYFLTTLELANGSGSDRMTGVVESPVFVLAGPELTLLVGGGKHAGTYVALCTLDGKEVAQVRGRQTETMFRVTWKAPTRIAGAAYGSSYGHIARGVVIEAVRAGRPGADDALRWINAQLPDLPRVLGYDPTWALATPRDKRPLPRGDVP